MARGFVDEGDGEVTFHHALIQDAAYERLLRKRRRQLHLRVAETAERLYGAGDDTIDLLARHLYLGGSPRGRRIPRARRPPSTQPVCERRSDPPLLAGARADTRRRRAMVGLADLYELTGEYEEAYALYDAARQREAGNMRAWCGMASTLRRRGEYFEALGWSTKRSPRRRCAARTSGRSGYRRLSLSVAGFYDAGIDVLTAGPEDGRRSARARRRRAAAPASLRRRFSRRSTPTR